jgi:tRNA(fMet)-specific endonuclease VapC
VRYLLDTNICIYIAKRKPEAVLRRLEQMKPGDIGMSVVSYAELSFGAWKSEQREANLEKLERLRRLIPVQPLGEDVTSHYGRIRADLECKGIPIGGYDLLIAAHALSLRLTLVTNNAREFAGVEGLRVENWTE